MSKFSKWLKQQANLNTMQELYAITLEGNHGREAVKEWIDGKTKYFDELTNETIVFLMDTPAQPLDPGAEKLGIDKL